MTDLENMTDEELEEMFPFAVSETFEMGRVWDYSLPFKEPCRFSREDIDHIDAMLLHRLIRRARYYQGHSRLASFRFEFKFQTIEASYDGVKGNEIYLRIGGLTVRPADSFSFTFEG